MSRPIVILSQVESAILDTIRSANCWNLGGFQGGCWSVRVAIDGSLAIDREVGIGGISAREFDHTQPHAVTVFQRIIEPAFVTGEEYDEFTGDSLPETDSEAIRGSLESAGFEVI